MEGGIAEGDKKPRNKKEDKLLLCEPERCKAFHTKFDPKVHFILICTFFFVG